MFVVNGGKKNEMRGKKKLFQVEQRNTILKGIGICDSAASMKKLVEIDSDKSTSTKVYFSFKTFPYSFSMLEDELCRLYKYTIPIAVYVHINAHSFVVSIFLYRKAIFD